MIDQLTTSFDLSALLTNGGMLENIVNDGGFVVILLLAMSTLVLTVTLLKLWQFQQLKVFKKRTADLALLHYRQGDARAALALLHKCRNPSSTLLRMGIQARQQQLDDQSVQQELACYGQEVLNTLRSKLRLLEVIAAIAPLLGLFGTVLGMIEAFQQLQAAGSQVNPALLSGGIWVALLTTACGLAVAMPTVVIINWLERHLEHLANDMSLTANRLFTPAIVNSKAKRSSKLKPL